MYVSRYALIQQPLNKNMKFKIHFLNCTSYISSAQQPPNTEHVHHCKKLFPNYMSTSSSLRLQQTITKDPSMNFKKALQVILTTLSGELFQVRDHIFFILTFSGLAPPHLAYNKCLIILNEYTSFAILIMTIPIQTLNSSHLNSLMPFIPNQFYTW